MRQVGAAEQEDGQAPAAFRDALAGLAAGRQQVTALRPELAFEDVPPPRTLAPYAAAFAATVTDGEDEVASGRFILLYDPAGQPGWGGPLRVIVYIRAELDPEIAADPLIGAVGWSWLTEALDRTGGYEAASGTVTRVVTEGFGGKADEIPVTGFELRASWSPAVPDGPGAEAGAGLAGHVTAWCGALCAASGLPPLAAGVTALRVPGARGRP
ncbi:MAG: DUF3000 family protein [Gemmatimonadota bacterium]